MKPGYCERCGGRVVVAAGMSFDPQTRDEHVCDEQGAAAMTRLGPIATLLLIDAEMRGVPIVPPMPPHSTDPEGA
jgi:hypothetical protein